MSLNQRIRVQHLSQLTNQKPGLIFHHEEEGPWVNYCYSSRLTLTLTVMSPGWLVITSLIIQTVKWLKLDPAEMSNIRRSLSVSVIENNALSDNVWSTQLLSVPLWLWHFLGKFSAWVSLETGGDKTWLCLVWVSWDSSSCLVSQSEAGIWLTGQSEGVWSVSGDKVEWSLDTGSGWELSVPSASQLMAAGQWRRDAWRSQSLWWLRPGH